MSKWIQKWCVSPTNIWKRVRIKRFYAEIQRICKLVDGKYGLLCTGFNDLKYLDLFTTNMTNQVPSVEKVSCLSTNFMCLHPCMNSLALKKITMGDPHWMQLSHTCNCSRVVNRNTLSREKYIEIIEYTLDFGKSHTTILGKLERTERRTSLWLPCFQFNWNNQTG